MTCDVLVSAASGLVGGAIVMSAIALTRAAVRWLWPDGIIGGRGT